MKITDVDNFVKMIFSNTPQDIGTFVLIRPRHTETSLNKPNSHADMFPILMDITTKGAKKLFGPSITPQTMTQEQLVKLNKYIMSLGYTIKHNYTHIDLETGLPTRLNIWFEPILQNILTDCRINARFA